MNSYLVRSRFATLANVETLENRRLLSSVSLSPNPDAVTTTLRIKGTDGKDTVTVYDDPQNNSVAVFDDKDHDGVVDSGEMHSYADANLQRISANMKKGDDKFILEAISTYAHQARSFDIDLKQGNNQFLFLSPTTSDASVKTVAVDSGGADFTEGSDISFSIEGESGKDHFTFDLSRTSILQSAVSINVNAEQGNDTVDLTMPDYTKFEQGIAGSSLVTDGVDGDSVATGIPAELQVQVELGSGNDTMNLHNSPTLIEIGIVEIEVRGEDGSDRFNDMEEFSLSEQSRVNISADLGSGNDTYEGKLDVSTRLPAGAGFVAQEGAGMGVIINPGAEATFNIQGGSGNDVLKFKDTFSDQPVPVVGIEQAPDFGNIEGLLEVQLHGGSGNDTTNIDLDPPFGMNVGPTGIIRAISAGDDGKDRDMIDLHVDSLSSGQYDLVVQGGGDNDKVSSTVVNDATAENTPEHYGIRGAVLIDGGRGSDKYDTEGNAPFSVRGVETLDETLEPDVL